MIVGLTCDLRTEYLKQGYKQEDVAEFDSEETLAALENAIRSLGHQTEYIGNAYTLFSKLSAGRKWDLVFNIAEGISGRFRESQVPCLLDMYGINYTFSDPLASALTLDKSLAKRTVRDFGVPTAGFEVVTCDEDIGNISMTYPVFAKPIAEGTGKGIDKNSVIRSPEQLSQICRCLLSRFKQPVLVEEFLPGREFTVAVLGSGSQARVLGVMEIKILNDVKDNVYSYDAKERCEELVQYLPYRKGPLSGQLEQLAIKSYKALQCRDAARVDFRCDEKGRPHFLEINPLPGLHPTHSDLPMIATQEGMSYIELIKAIIESALSRKE